MSVNAENIENKKPIEGVVQQQVAREPRWLNIGNILFLRDFFPMNRIHEYAFMRKYRSRFPLEVARAMIKNRPFTSEDMEVIERVANTDWTKETLSMSNPEDIEFAAKATSLGAVLCYGFGNFYAVAAHPAYESVVNVNRSKGRPDRQVGSLTTTRDHIEHIFDWSKLPEKLNKDIVMNLMDDLFELGPFGFRGPASAGLPDQLISQDGDRRTTQMIAPGYKCPSNALLERILELANLDYIFITSANISHNLKGTTEEPAHYKITGIQTDFGQKKGYVMLSHGDEDQTRLSYPLHKPMSTTILSFHKMTYGRHDEPMLFLERHGSLHKDDVLDIVKKHGFGLEIAPSAQYRLPQRQYQD